LASPSFKKVLANNLGNANRLSPGEFVTGVLDTQDPSPRKRYSVLRPDSFFGKIQVDVSDFQNIPLFQAEGITVGRYFEGKMRAGIVKFEC
jgi:hypothetical protein